MANRERNKRSARQARQRERAAQDAQAAAGGSDTSASSQKESGKEGSTSLAKGAKSGPFAGIRTYIGDVRSEMHRVVWPSRKELTNYSVAVVVMLVIFGVLVWAVDTGFVALLVAFTGLRG